MTDEQWLSKALRKIATSHCEPCAAGRCDAAVWAADALAALDRVPPRGGEEPAETRLVKALAAAVAALKAGEPWHYSGCEGCAEIQRVLEGARGAGQ